MNIIALWSAWSAWRGSRALLRQEQKRPSPRYDDARKIEGRCELLFQFVLANKPDEVVYTAEHAANVLEAWNADGNPKIWRLLKDVKRVLKFTGRNEALSLKVRNQAGPPDHDISARVPGPYVERFPVGSVVRVRDADFLRKFMQDWKLHHPLRSSQLQYADLTSRVTNVSFYHGGDVLYVLADTGNFIWHEQCLQACGQPLRA